MLNPAAEFEYSPRVRELFDQLKHAGLPDRANARALETTAGAVEQGAQIRLQLALSGDRITAARYQAYGCPHFLAACESLATWLEGRTVAQLAQWRWRDVEAELQVPGAKRARLLVLDDALRALRGAATT